MTRYPHCFLNGKFLREDKAHISINDIGLLRGYGVFDFIRTYKGKPFLLEKHLARLNRSSANIGIISPYTNEEIVKLIDRILTLNDFRESSIKILITGGNSEDGVSLGSIPTFLILNKKIDDSELPNTVSNGVKIITSEHLRTFADTKTLNYINLIKNFDTVKQQNAYTLLYTSKGLVLECATSNIFAVSKGKVITPKDDILYGITRNAVIDIARGEYKVEERTLKFQELIESDEVFLTSTTKGIVPVVQIDDHQITGGKPGKVTLDLITKYNKFASNEVSKK